jgi:hypothetical protein
MIWLLLLAWILASFICAGLWAIAGLRLTRMQERNRFAWQGKPLRYLELDVDEYERVDTPLDRARRVM